MAFSPDGARLAAANDGAALKVWDLATSQGLATLPSGNATNTGVAFSPDGTRIAVGGDVVKVWDAKNYTLIRPLEDGGKADWHRLVFSPDGARLASASYDRTPIIWDLATGKPSLHLGGHASKVWGLAFSPDGSRLASGSLDGSVRVWDMADGRPLLTLKGHANGITSVAYSPDGSRLLSASKDGTVKVWDANSDPESTTIAVGSATVAFSPDGSQIATIDGNRAVLVRDADTGQATQTIPGPVNGISNLAFSPDGSRIAAGCGGRTARIWEVGSRREVSHLAGHPEEIRGVAFSPDGAYLATVCGDQSVTVWDLVSRRVRFTCPGSSRSPVDHREPYGISFSQDGRWLAAGSDDGAVRVWDADTGQDAFDGPFPGHAGPVRGVAFYPESHWLASSGEDGAIKIWDLTAGREVWTFSGHAEGVRWIAFSGDGRRLFSASTDETARIWDVATGQEVLTLRGHSSSVWRVAISRESERLATASIDGTVKIWDSRPWSPDEVEEREALGRLAFLFARPLPRANVIADLKGSVVLRPGAREIALGLVDCFHEVTAPEPYHRASWALVRQPYLNAFQYRFALLQAEHACRLAPDRKEYRICLGAALYRAGRYQEAIETLGKVDRPDTGSPTALTFLAMSHHQLGHQEQARAVLARLRQLPDQPPAAKDAETLGLVNEAEALIAPPATATKQ